MASPSLGGHQIQHGEGGRGVPSEEVRTGSGGLRKKMKQLGAGGGRQMAKLGPVTDGMREGG
ncbi:hypothetical protein E2562_001211 [Oryza meyeriana var. granulata]|uniref:Uncharacterized protein n=1 Tax=Oryza meyeriana var. granulata TaxID=110450 RepID=A0A6G1DB57_9ORYZ|nr:hypothetical protein E2562_001211 [Oryza meyeriana var. granulata]